MQKFTALTVHHHRRHLHHLFLCDTTLMALLQRIYVSKVSLLLMLVPWEVSSATAASGQYKYQTYVQVGDLPICLILDLCVVCLLCLHTLIASVTGNVDFFRPDLDMLQCHAIKHWWISERRISGHLVCRNCLAFTTWGPSADKLLWVYKIWDRKHTEYWTCPSPCYSRGSALITTINFKLFTACAKMHIVSIGL